MRALLLLGKDLKILARSPLLLAAFVLYPLLIAALVGVAVRYADQRPRVAFVDVDGLPQKLVVAGHAFDVQSVLDEVANQVDLVRLSEPRVGDLCEHDKLLHRKGFADLPTL